MREQERERHVEVAVGRAVVAHGAFVCGNLPAHKSGIDVGRVAFTEAVQTVKITSGVRVRACHVNGDQHSVAHRFGDVFPVVLNLIL